MPDRRQWRPLGCWRTAVLPRYESTDPAHGQINRALPLGRKANVRDAGQ